MTVENTLVHSYDDRRNFAIPGDLEATVQFCAAHFVESAAKSIEIHGRFAVALSGGSTPKAIFKALTQEPFRSQVEWAKVLVFWSDERCVPPDSPESNYKMAVDSGLIALIPPNQVFRMEGEENPEHYASEYQKLLRQKLKGKGLDYVMLGVGEDGHTASLFPETHGLHADNHWAVANYVPQKDTWRLTLTYDCINASHHIVIYALGEGKAEIIKKIFTTPYQPDRLPVQRIGTPTHKALWIMDKQAAALFKSL